MWFCFGGVLQTKCFPQTPEELRNSSRRVTPPPLLLRRQLTKEQLDLKGALERQMTVNQTLSQEKEQLVFKLRHRESCPSIHLPAMMQEIAPR